MAKVDQPLFIIPKKRNGKKVNTIASHVDHIITVQVNSVKLSKYYFNTTLLYAVKIIVIKILYDIC